MGRRKQRAPALRLGAVESRAAFHDALTESLDDVAEDSNVEDSATDDDDVQETGQPAAKRRCDPSCCRSGSVRRPCSVCNNISSIVREATKYSVCSRYRQS